MKNKNIFISFILLLTLFLPLFNLNTLRAEEDVTNPIKNSGECDIEDFNYQVLPTLSSYVTIKLSWYTINPMNNLIIETYNQALDEYVISFSYEWLEVVTDELGNEMTIVQEEYDCYYKEVFPNKTDEYIFPPSKEPLKEGLDDIEYIYYEVRYKLLTEELGTLKLKFHYSSNDLEYQSIIYVPAGINKVVDNSRRNLRRAILAAIYASLMAVCGTFIVVLSTKRKTLFDEEGRA